MGIVNLGQQATAPIQEIVQVPGDCMRMKADIFKASVNSSDMLYGLLQRYTHALIVQASQLVACKSHHSMQQRCCRSRSTTQG